VLAWLLDFRGIYDNALYCGLVGIMQSTGIGDANNSLGIAHEKDNNILLQGIMTTAKLCCLCKNRRMLTLV
jgi:hypothetical protein